VVLALATYGDVAGPLGSSLRRFEAYALGFGEDTVPVSLVAAGAVLILGRARRGVLSTLGAVFTLAVATAGIGDLAGHEPGIHAPTAVLEGAGGVVGAAVGGALRHLVGGPVSVLLLLAVCFPAVCACVGLPVKAAAVGIGRGTWAVGRAIGSGLSIRIAGLSEPLEEPDDQHSLDRARASSSQWSDGTPGAFDEDPPAGREPPAEEPLERLIFDQHADRGGAGSVDEAAAVGEVDTLDLPGGAADGLDLGGDVIGGAVAVPAVGKAEQLGLGVIPPPSHWRLPQAKLLSQSKKQAFDEREIEARGKALEASLRSHGVETHLVGATIGPTVTRFELELGEGVKVARVTSLQKDIAYAMASPDVRILAPIPGRSAIGVEVPNVNRQLVTLGDVLASDEARRARHPLEVGLGRDIAGRSVMANLAEMPHLLIAGATGAGKSSCINSIITSILMRATPEEVRLILVDPKRVELGQYNGLPHLLTQVVVNPKKAANALNWAVAEMERRYDLLAELGMRDITGYNAAIDRGEFADGPFDQGVASATEEGGEAAPEPRFSKLPFILIVVDELNDLMMVAARDVEESICRIAQMARAVGIHLVIATQRPSVDVITGVIKANVPSRLAFSVSSLADSRVILDQPGAERLVGRGDLLLLTASSSIARRIQGPWVSEDEVRSVVGAWRRQSSAQYVEGVVGGDEGPGGVIAGEDGDDDELLRAATELVVRSQLGSTSMLQRKLRVGFARAGRLMDLLERQGIVGPSEGSKARTVLMTPDELDQIS
jgi:S-DNA-T family DNA segregation ATPase FtsK/SpoIIIE